MVLSPFGVLTKVRIQLNKIRFDGMDHFHHLHYVLTDPHLYGKAVLVKALIQRTYSTSTTALGSKSALWGLKPQTSLHCVGEGLSAIFRKMCVCVGQAAGLGELS